MKSTYKTLIFCLLIGVQGFSAVPRSMTGNNETRYTKRLNVGFGYNYYAGIPFIVNYELSNRTLGMQEDPLEQYQLGLTFAPQFGFYRYTDWYPSPLRSFSNYNYSVNNLFFGVKTHFYFDRVLKMPEALDLYFAMAPQIMIRRVTWDYDAGIPDIYKPNNRWLANRRGVNAFVLPIHIGAEYKLSKKFGVWGDIGTMMSTVGLSVKL